MRIHVEASKGRRGYRNARLPVIRSGISCSAVNASDIGEITRPPETVFDCSGSERTTDAAIKIWILTISAGLTSGFSWANTPDKTVEDVEWDALGILVESFAMFALDAPNLLANRDVRTASVSRREQRTVAVACH